MKKMLCIPLYSVRMQENTGQKNLESEYFSRIDVADFESMFQFHTPPPPRKRRKMGIKSIKFTKLLWSLFTIVYFLHWLWQAMFLAFDQL